VEPDLTIEEIEAGGLPGPVGADQRDDLAPVHLEGEAVDRADPAVGFADPRDGQEAHETPARRNGAGRYALKLPAMPLGNTRTSAMITPPRIRRQWSSK